jgi:hypothetical protein
MQVRWWRPFIYIDDAAAVFASKLHGMRKLRANATQLSPCGEICEQEISTYAAYYYIPGTSNDDVIQIQHERNSRENKY